MSSPMDDTSLGATYQERGYGGRVGFGNSPAVVVVDFMRAFTDPACPLGMDLADELAACRRVLDAARGRGLPVALTVCAYHPSFADAGLWKRKIQLIESYLAEGSPWVAPDEALGTHEQDVVVVKKFASGFFGTPLQPMLQGRGVDTVIVTGCTTSGCVRATVVDAISHGYHTIVPADAVGDRAEAPHEASLFDMDAKYADVLDSAEVIDYLNRVAVQQDTVGR